MFTTEKKNGISVKAYKGDAMTLLAFDIDQSLNTPDFVGFSIGFSNPENKVYFQNNRINFDGQLGYFPSDSAPFQKFRWLHVPGNHYEQFNNNIYGQYTYHIYARYWDKQNNSLKPLDENLKVDIQVDVAPFEDSPVEVGFTRSFVTSQAFVSRFGKNVQVVPANSDLLFDTSKPFATSGGQKYSYEQAYEWMGFMARKKIIDILQEVKDTKGMTADLFTYDFNEPVIASLCLDLAAAGKARIISDDYIKKTTDKKTGKVKQEGHGLKNAPETEFAGLFEGKKTGDADMVRGHFARFQHNKIIIVKKNGTPLKVLSGSTNFSITGICVNANHVVIFNDANIAKFYSDYFDKAWTFVTKGTSFSKDPMAGQSKSFKTANQAAITITVSPHTVDFATKILSDIAAQIQKKGVSSVLFSIMQMTSAGGAVMPALKAIQGNTKVFSYGVSDATDSVALYKPGSRRGILVNAKQLIKELPKPFAQETRLSAHNIHHKFIVIDFNKPSARVYFGSSNLALGGEQQNGDNLICVQDPDVATAFGIEAIRLVDHFHFRANKQQAVKSNKPIMLAKDNKWTKPYFDKNDIKFTDRELFK
jgi:hypothetical protein